MNVKRVFGNVLLGLMAIGLVLAVVVNFTILSTPVSQAAVIVPDVLSSACAGTINTHNDPGEPDPITSNVPKVCLFHLHGFNFDPGSIVDWWIKPQPGDDTVVLSGAATILADGSYITGQFNLPDGQYKLYWQEADCIIKHKVFQVDCAPPTAVPPTAVPPTEVPPTAVPPTAVPPTEVPPTAVPPTEVPPTEVPPTEVPPTVTPVPTNPFELATPTFTATPVPPTATPVPTNPFELATPTFTATPVPPTATPVPTEPAELPTPTPRPTEPSRQDNSYISVLCQGCWSNEATLWVGGTEQKPPQRFELDSENWPAVHWTLWNIVPWEIRVKVSLPAGLDPNRWKFILWVGTGPKDYLWTNETTFTINPRQTIKVDFQLVDTVFWQ